MLAMTAMDILKIIVFLAIKKMIYKVILLSVQVIDVAIIVV
jgi:hypothetical protein